MEKSRPRVASITLDDPSPVDAGLLSFAIAFEVEMDTKVNPVVTFGISSPYDNHNITGTWKDQTTWAGSYVIDESTGDGDNIINVSSATSSFGLAMDDDMSNSFVIDTVSPEVTSFAIDNDDLYVSSTSVSVSVTADDTGAGVAEVMIDDDASLSGGTWIPHEGSVDYTVTSGDGTKTLYGKVRDGAGNESSLVSDSITLDTLSPTIQITNPAQGSTLSGSILITADISDLNGISSATLYIDGKEVKSYTQAPYEYDFDTTAFADGPLGVATSPVFNQVFVANSFANTVSVIDGTSNQEIKRVDVGEYPYALTVTPDGSYVLVSNGAENTVSVIETESFTVSNTIQVG